MAKYHLHAAGLSSPITDIATGAIEKLQDLSKVLREVAQEYILPTFGQHYDTSGLRKGSGVLKSAVSKPGAKGNVLELRPTGLTAGVDYASLPYARYVFEGRGVVRAKNKKALRFLDSNGKPIFAKSVRAVAAHQVIYLTQGELDEVARRIEQKIAAEVK